MLLHSCCEDSRKIDRLFSCALVSLHGQPEHIVPGSGRLDDPISSRSVCIAGCLKTRRPIQKALCT